MLYQPPILIYFPLQCLVVIGRGLHREHITNMLEAYIVSPGGEDGEEDRGQIGLHAYANAEAEAVAEAVADIQQYAEQLAQAQAQAQRHHLRKCISKPKPQCRPLGKIYMLHETQAGHPKFISLMYVLHVSFCLINILNTEAPVAWAAAPPHGTHAYEPFYPVLKKQAFSVID